MAASPLHPLARIGSGCLVVSLLLFLFAHPQGQTTNNVVHFVAGLLLGVSLPLMIRGMYAARRNNPSDCAR